MLRPLTVAQRRVDVAIGAGYVLLLAVSLLRTEDLAPRLPELVLLGAALALRRWSPPAALALCWAGGLALMLGGLTASFETLAILPVVATVAELGSRPARLTALTSSVVAGPIAALYIVRDEVGSLADPGGPVGRAAWSNLGLLVVVIGVSLLLSWTVGTLIRTARQSGARARAAEVATQEVAAEQERVRIARDMHDVVAHSLAVVIAQSDGARLLGRADPESVDEALGVIGAVSRAALADVRVLLQQLRYEGSSAVQPSLADLDTLIARFRASGLDVDLRRSGGAEGLGAAVQLAAFRVLQESLTNALRHADPAATVEVRLAREQDGLELIVSSALAHGVAPGIGGHGLIGMRERAALVGGRFAAGPDGGRFVVRALLPAAVPAEATA